MNDSLGTLSTVDGKPVLRFERRLAHPCEKVWTAITDPAEMAHWFPATVTTELRAGAEMRFAFGEDALDGTGRYAEGEILEYDPPRVYAFRWAESVLRFEIVPDGPGCVLVFSQLLSGRERLEDRPSVARQGPGWDACLALLAARLDGTTTPAHDAPWFLERAERYVERFGLGEGEVVDAADTGWLLRFERDLTQPASEVWATLAEGETPAPGRAAPVRFTHGYLQPGPVTVCEPGRVVEYAWCHDGSEAGWVRFELRDQEPIGTRLVVTQTLPRDHGDLRATALAAWQTHLELLFAALHGDVRCPWPTERTERLRETYAARL
jgi:uncharacterized protein YndB with AHSA1/START domain